MFIKSIKKIVVVTLAMLITILCFYTPSLVYAIEQLPNKYTIDESLLVKRTQENDICWAFSFARMLQNYNYYKWNNKEELLNISEDWLSVAYQYHVNHVPKNKLVSGIDDENYKYGNSGLPEYAATVINEYGYLLKSEFTEKPSDITPSNVDAIFNKYKNKTHKNMSNIVVSEIGSYLPLNLTEEEQEEYTGTYSTQEDIVKRIKYCLIQTGGVVTSINVDDYFNFTDYSVYYFDIPDVDNIDDNTFSLNHSVAIVGFDDTFTKTLSGVSGGTKTVTGAFKVIDSNSGLHTNTDEPDYIYIPYCMFEPKIKESTDYNKVITQTYFISNGTYTPDVDGGANIEVSTKTKIIIAIVVSVILILLIVVVPSVVRKTGTKSLNKHVTMKYLTNYEKLKQQNEIRRAEIEAEIAELKNMQALKKQKRLQREFARIQELKKGNNKPISNESVSDEENNKDLNNTNLDNTKKDDE